MNKIQKFQYSRLVFTTLLLTLAGAAEAAIVQSNVSTNVFPAYNTASAVDLVNSDQASLVSMTVSEAPHISFPENSLNDGISDLVALNKNVYFTTLPSEVTFTLNTSVNTNGYDITGVNTFAGWNGGKAQFANQKYELWVSVVGDANFTKLHDLDYQPYSSGTAGSSWVSLSDSSGVMATRVDAVRLVLQSPGSATVYQEIDVMGAPVSGSPVSEIPPIALPLDLEPAEVTYHWNGLANDGDWTNAGNWLNDQIPADTAAVVAGLNGNMLIVIDSDHVPTSNIPVLQGQYSGTVSDSPMVLLKKGTLEFSVGGDGYYKHISGKNHKIIEVGDGVSAAKLTLTPIDRSYLTLSRHGGGNIHLAEIHRYAELAVTTNLWMSLNDTRSSQIWVGFEGKLTIDGSIYFKGSTNSFISIASGGSVHALYGGDFTDLSGVTAALGTQFRGSYGAALIVTDTGVGFIVSPTESESGVPFFLSNPLMAQGAKAGIAYSNTLASLAIDPDGDPMFFSLVSGDPAWLAVATNGVLSGTPGANDTGLNSWIVEVTDGTSGTNQATLQIDVAAPPPTGQSLNHILGTGQSLSVGWNGGPPLSTTQPYNNLMLSGVGQTGNDLIPLVEGPNLRDAEVETISSALANTLTALSPQTNYTSIVTRHGDGAKSYASLKKGTSYYAKGMDQVQKARAFALAYSNEYRVVAVTTVHGESDHKGGTANYDDLLLEWRSDYDADVKVLTGQTNDVPMFFCQMSSHTRYNDATSLIPYDQLWVAENSRFHYMVCPKYFLPYSDGVHLTAQGYRLLGEYYGKALKQVLVDGLDWQPLKPTKISLSGAVITVKFHVPAPPLITDSSTVFPQTNWGFEYADDTSSAAINNVSIVAGDTIEITLNTIPTGANPRVRYAYTGVAGAYAGSDGAARGNIRDSDPTPSLYGNNLYNWLVHFDHPLPFNPARDDFDGDGVPDQWEYISFEGTNVSHGALSNIDGDSMTDYAEWAAGTDPSDAADIFLLRSERVGSALSMSWDMLVGRYYTLYGTTNLVSTESSWTNLLNVVGWNGSITYTNNGHATQQFYRIDLNVE